MRITRGIRHVVYSSVYRICMLSKGGKKLYLEVVDCYTDKHGNIVGRKYGWTFKKSNAITVETEVEAKDIASNYFKNFDKWFIDEEYGPTGSV